MRHEPLLLTILGIALVASFVMAVYRYVTDFSSVPSAEGVSVEVTSVVEEEQVFIMLGDTGTGNENQYAVADAIGSYCEGEKDFCQAAFIVGDVIYDYGVTSLQDPQFGTKFEEPYAQLDMPFYLAFGNHDVFGCTECYISYSELSDKWNMPARYYSVDYKDTYFHVIDTEQFDEEQQDWLAMELAKNPDAWQIVVGHKPLYTLEITHSAEKWAGIQELKELLCTDADVYVSGHAHVLEDVGQIEGCTVHQLISGSGGAWPREVEENDTDLFYHEDNGFLALAVSRSEIAYTFVSKEGEVLFEHQVVR